MVDLGQPDRLVHRLEETLRRFEPGAPPPVGARELLRELHDALAEGHPEAGGLSPYQWETARSIAATGLEGLEDERPEVQGREAEKALRRLSDIFKPDAAGRGLGIHPAPAPTPALAQRPSPRRSRWPYVSLLPFGIGAWVPIYAGVRARQKVWILLGILWFAIWVAGVIKAPGDSSGNASADSLATFLWIVAWAGAIVTSFTIRASYDRRMSSGSHAARQDGRGDAPRTA